MSLLNSERVSFGGRRTSTAPPGMGTDRKKTACKRLGAAMSWIQRDRSARASTHAASAKPHRLKACATLRRDFNLHLLASDVVREVFRRDRQRVSARCQMRRNQQ